MAPVSSMAQVVINEIMQSNIDCIMDDINEFPDSWIELYNTGTSAVNLSQYKIGDSNDESAAWQLPSQTLAAKGRVLVYCDKEESGLHTSFRLESGKGGEVYLFKNGSVEDELTGLKKQPAPNIAYGRKTDGASEWGYMAEPTPGTSNCGTIVKDILGEPVFSEKGKVVTGNKSFSLTLSVPEGAPAGTEIRVTYDGTEPTKNSILYSSPITIGATRIVRAKLFCDGYMSPRSTTHSYIFFPREMTLPVFSIVTNKKYFEDSAIGIYVDGNMSDGKKNYEHDWRRPINLEMFMGEGEESQINQLCETRIMGGASRGNKMKSLAIYANKRFGTKRFTYEFFPEQKPGLNDFKSISLRNAGNDFDYLYMRDAIIQRSMAENCDLDWQAWMPAVVYINGVYKGMLNLRERSNEDNIYTNYDGLEDIDMFENWWELKAGDWDNYNLFKEFYTEHGHTLAEYDKWMDTMEFLNLMIMNLYYNNQDFPGNNIVMWRPKTDEGRWRFIAKDTDFGLGLYGSSPTYKTIEWLYNPYYDSEREWANGYDHTRLFRRLMEDADFNREFIDRCAIYIGDFLREERVRELWDAMYEIIKTEYPNHRKLVNEYWPKYEDELGSARYWLAERAGNFYQQLSDYYKVGSPVPMSVNMSYSDDELSDMTIEMNGVKLTRGKFDGKFFKGRKMSLTSMHGETREVRQWNVSITSSNGTVNTETVDGDSYTFDMPDASKVDIKAIFGTYDAIETISDSNDLVWKKTKDGIMLQNYPEGSNITIYNINGIPVFNGKATNKNIKIALPKNNIYIIRCNDRTSKTSL
ncbi:MAG: CotH kinase family protein [Prevotella sp.]